MWLWGHDFHFVDSDRMFDTMDRVIAQVNAETQKHGVRLRYSTPDRYFEALHGGPRGDRAVRFPQEIGM